MAIPNLICMVALTPVLVTESRRYLWNGALDEVDNSLVQPAELVEETGPAEAPEVDEWDLEPAKKEEKEEKI